MKVVLSQTIFANVSTVPESAGDDSVVPRLEYAEPGAYIDGDRLAADADSNGWPQSPRNEALRAIRRGLAFHLAGDQHLASFVHYGVDTWEDAGCAFCVPSIANVWPRRWYPPLAGQNRRPDAPRYTGRFLDGFGNHVTVHAVANPVRSGRKPRRLYDRSPGYGIVRFDPQARNITAECWPRWVDPSRPGARQYAGWPVTVRQTDGYARRPASYLPTVVVEGTTDPVVRVIDEASGEIVYSLRIRGNRFRPPVFTRGPHAIQVGQPHAGPLRTIPHIRPTDDKNDSILVRL
jgi:hypothetical protein